jgi:hypothetical protein
LTNGNWCQIADILTTPADARPAVVNMLQGGFQQDNAYNRLYSYLTEFKTGLALP